MPELGISTEKVGFLIEKARQFDVKEAISDPDRAAAKRAFDAMMDMKKIDIARIEKARRGAA